MTETEIKRIIKAYKKRDKAGKNKLYSFFNKAALFTYHQREKAILEVLASQGIRDLSDKKILDVGCGRGGVLRDFVKYGASPQNLYGIDLLEDRIEKAKKLYPHINFLKANAENLSYSDNFFDIVICFTVFSSIFDKDMKSNIAKEMIRVLKKNGFILWYDYFVNNPQNPDVKGIRKKEIKNLFSTCKIHLKRVTLAPPITRMLADKFYLLCYLLEKIKPLNTHYLGVIIKKVIT